MPLRSFKFVGSVFGLFAILLCSTVVGQAIQISPGVPVRQVVVPQIGKAVPAATPATPAAAQAAAATTAAAKPATGTVEQKKVELLLEEKFDHSTATLLKAWSDKQQPKDEQEKQDPEEQPSKGLVKVSYDGFAVVELEKPSKFKLGEVVRVSTDDAAAGDWKLLSVKGSKISMQKQVAKKKPESKTKPDVQAPADKAVDAKAKGETVAKEEAADAKPKEAAEQKPEAKKELKKPEEESAETVAKKSDEEEPVKNEPAKSDATIVELKPDASVEILLVKEEKEKKPDVAKQAKAEVDAFVRDVALGNWKEVKSFLADIKKEDAEKVYSHLLKSLATAQRKKGQPSGGRNQVPPAPQISPSDILQLADASPSPIKVDTGKEDDSKDAAKSPDKTKKAAASLPSNVVLPPGMTVDQLPPEALAALANAGGAVPVAAAGSSAVAVAAKKPDQIAALARLMVNAKKAGHDFADFHAKIKAGTEHFGGEDAGKKLAAADLFMKSQLIDRVEEFLPELDEEGTSENLPALKIWSQLALAKHAEKNVADWLEKAWKINQWIVGIEDLKKKDKDFALANLLKLSTKIEKETGVAWINESFTEQPERGQRILTNLGIQSADMASKSTTIADQTRFDLLQLQNESVEKLIELSPETAKEWAPALTLLAQNWLLEADTSLKYSQQTNRGGSYMEIDMYGNYYWMNQNQRQHNGRRPRPIKISDMLAVAPSDGWQDLIHKSLHTNLQQTKSKMYMRVNEEEKAFPFIEQIATTHPKVGRELVHLFLTTWTQNHDPNSSNRRRNPYIYSYGFDRKAEAIPLTRSQQERNLNELAGWVDRIRKLPIEDVDESLLANAFTNCHSSAEVFELERFREVFGDLSKLEPKTIAAICQKMRASLASSWRSIRTQEQKQTNRREPEVQQEVLDGYKTANTLLTESLSGAPDNWKLHLAKAMLMHDENAYAQLVQKSAEFSDRRDAAFDQFQVAADKYSAVVTTLEEKEQSTEAFDFWFYASLGASDLGNVTDKTVPDLKQYEKIKSAMDALPGLLAESHMAKFANNLFTRMSPIKPEIKFRYLRGGFEIAGDHPRAWEARKLFSYYKDLVHEIKLDVSIDGSDKIEPNQPFGAYVSILHTTEIEREAGGFGKYSQNQNAMSYAYNYGRPTENYRDKFTDAVDLALAEHFEIQSVTFKKTDKMKSMPADKPGWRVTPYAYVLLKPKGPEVDRIAPLKIDLDFLDTSGYVVIPVESPALVIDCSVDNAPIRPVSDLQVTQTLDERQASDGKLIVEVAASGKGLVPELEDIIDIERDGFEVVSVDDQGVLPTEFDAESNDIQILSDRSWTVEYKAKEAAEASTSFAFSEAKLDGADSKFQRYKDADLVEVEKMVELEQGYDAFSWAFLYWLIPAVILGLVGLCGLVYVTSRPTEEVAKRFNMPEDINPFTVLTLLKDIKARNGISSESGIELQNSINRIEKFYFGEAKDVEAEDLEQLAKTWVGQAK